jgi:hypothetical protein
MKTFPNFKSRASQSGKLATNPRSKTELLSETTKTYLKEWATEQVFGVRKNISSKAIEKGIVLEDEAIDLTVQVLDIPFILKNEATFEDDYFTGTPDIILDNEIIDIKVSWDAFTFPYFENEVPTKDYFYQLQVYMHLTGKRSARLVYVLLNTPENLMYEIADDYSNIDPKLRVKTFTIEYDETVIEMLKERVIESRNFVNELLILNQ